MASETLRSISFDEIEQLRTEIDAAGKAAASVADAAAVVATKLGAMARTVVLARMFAVVPFGSLPSTERDWAAAFAHGVGRLQPLPDHTPVLTLLGTAGAERAWNDRLDSVGHRAIPLIDRSFVEGAPMIAALLSSLKLDLGQRLDGSIELRTVPGGLNARFLVEDARASVDGEGRHIIGAQPFVQKHGLRSVFGMGGSYVGGAFAVAILFTREQLHGGDVDRFTSLISTFKMATASQLAAGWLFAP